MVIQRGEIWWADLADRSREDSGYRRPVLIVQADSFNRSRLPTVLALVLSSSMRLLDAPGNVLLPRKNTGLSRDSVALVTQVVTLSRKNLVRRTGALNRPLMDQVEEGLRLVSDLR